MTFRIKTIDKLMLRSYLGPMILTFFIVMFVLMMNFVWRYIDDLVGKGLGMGVISELMLHAAVNVIPMALPLATLLAAIMTMGNLGENYELLAMKSAGMSLPRIMRPLLVVVAFVSVGSFFVANNLVPYSTREMQAILWDIRQQKQTIEFRDGVFFNGIENMSIRVGRQDPATGLLRDVLIYDNRPAGGKKSTTVADSGYIRLSDDRQSLLVTLYDGASYEGTAWERFRGAQTWYDDNKLSRRIFEMQDAVIPLEGYDFSRSSTDAFTNGRTKNVVQLGRGIDSLDTEVQAYMEASYGPFLGESLFSLDKGYAVDSLRGMETAHVKPFSVTDSLEKMDVRQQKRVWNDALQNASNSLGNLAWDEDNLKFSLRELLTYRAEWHRKISLPVSIMIFFLIGVPLGAIIRRGGLGMPIVVSVIFFVIYYVISIMGEKMATEGTWSSIPGMWLSTFVLLPIAIFLIYKATNDSNLFNAEWYIMKYRALRDFTKRVITGKTNSDGKIAKSAR